MITLYDTDKKTKLANAIPIDIMQNKYEFDVITQHPSVTNVKCAAVLYDAAKFDRKTREYPIEGFQTITRAQQDFRFGMISETEFYLLGETLNIDSSKERT